MGTTNAFLLYILCKDNNFTHGMICYCDLRFCVFDTKKTQGTITAGGPTGCFDTMLDTLEVKLYNQLYKFIKLPIFKYAVV